METPSKFEMKLKTKVSLKNEDVNPIFDGCTADNRWKKGSIVSPESQLWTDSGLIVNQNWFEWIG